MVAAKNLQSEINTILGSNSSSNSQPQIKPVHHVTSDTPTITTPPNPTTANTNVVTPTPQTITAPPAVDVPQVAQNVPPIQTQVDYSQSSEKQPKKESNKLIPVILISVLIVLGIVSLIVFRKSIFGPMSYADCLKTPESTHVGLEPKYCATIDGEIFFENKNASKTLKSDEPVATFDPKLIPTSNPPNQF